MAGREELRRHHVCAMEDLDGKDGETKKEIAAKLSVLGGGLKVTIRRRDNANINRHGSTPADAINDLLFDGAKEFTLRCERQLADLVEKDGAAGGQLELAGATLGRAGERAAFVAEEFRLDQCFGNRAQLMATKGLSRRGLRWWTARAKSSLRCLIRREAARSLPSRRHACVSPTTTLESSDSPMMRWKP